jgi:hypothetical protein
MLNDIPHYPYKAALQNLSVTYLPPKVEPDVTAKREMTVDTWVQGT